MSNQAKRIIDKFGGPREIIHALSLLDDPEKHRTLGTVYKWTWPRSRGGTNNRVPTAALDSIMEAARLVGVIITPEDLYRKE